MSASPRPNLLKEENVSSLTMARAIFGAVFGVLIFFYGIPLILCLCAAALLHDINASNVGYVYVSASVMLGLAVIYTPLRYAEVWMAKRQKAAGSK